MPLILLFLKFAFTIVFKLILCKRNHVIWPCLKRFLSLSCYCFCYLRPLNYVGSLSWSWQCTTQADSKSKGHGTLRTPRSCITGDPYTVPLQCGLRSCAISPPDFVTKCHKRWPYTLNLSPRNRVWYCSIGWGVNRHTMQRFPVGQNGSKRTLSSLLVSQWVEF